MDTKVFVKTDGAEGATIVRVDATGKKEEMALTWEDWGCLEDEIALMKQRMRLRQAVTVGGRS